jgi:predicted GNAT family N-acyltransferase
MPEPDPPIEAAPGGPRLEIRPAEGAADRQHVVAIRTRVFVEGQDCPPEEEFDGLDPHCRHVLAWLGGEPVGTARWREVTTPDGRRSAKLERFAVLPEHQGRGHGRALVAHLLDEARAAGHRCFVLHAQAHLEGFYAGFGFERRGEGFIEAGIPHVRMVREEGARQPR